SPRPVDGARGRSTGSPRCPAAPPAGGDVADVGADGGPLLVALPDGLGRTMPLPPVRDALKFTTYAAVGAVAAAVFAPIWWLPFLGGGFALSVLRPDGKALDERFGQLVAFELRSGRGPRRGSRSPGPR